jgi:hypothetical protein
MKQYGSMLTTNTNGSLVEELSRKLVPLAFKDLLSTRESTPDEEKIQLISNHFKQIMLILGLDLRV